MVSFLNAKCLCDETKYAWKILIFSSFEYIIPYIGSFSYIKICLKIFIGLLILFLWLICRSLTSIIFFSFLEFLYVAFFIFILSFFLLFCVNIYLGWEESFKIQIFFVWVNLILVNLITGEFNRGDFNLYFFKMKLIAVNLVEWT